MIIERVERLLKKLRIISPFSEDDMINASIEDKYRDHESLIGRLQVTLHNRLATNDRLREAIRIAKSRTSSFEDFERVMIHREGDRRD
jgi:hypothetical protein